MPLPPDFPERDLWDKVRLVLTHLPPITPGLTDPAEQRILDRVEGRG